MFLWGSAAALFALPEGTLRGAVLGSLLWRGLTLRLCNMMNVTVSFHSLQHAPILGFTCHALSQRLVFLRTHTHTRTHTVTYTHAHTHTHTHSHKHTHMCTHTYTHAHAHTHTPTHIHTYTHAHTQCGSFYSPAPVLFSLFGNVRLLWGLVLVFTRLF